MPDKPMTDAEGAWQRERLKYIPAWLRAKDLSQKDVALSLGVSEPTISKWLGGTQRMPLSAFVRLASVFGAQPYELHVPPHVRQFALDMIDIDELLLQIPTEDLPLVLAAIKALCEIGVKRKGGAPLP